MAGAGGGGSKARGYPIRTPVIDLVEIGAGGGSIAWVDEGGLLHVGPQSAGADPGPACYGRGGTRPTVTDASLVLGYLHPDHFLGGRIALDADAARSSIEEHVGRPLGLGPREAAAAVLELATEHMIHAIEDITLNQGIDPRTAVLVGGGGAAGLNVVSIARRLGCPRVIIPDVAATLSAAGGLMSDLTTDYARVLTSASASFDFAAVNEVLEDLDARAAEFIAGPGAGSSEAIVEFTAEARYPHQVWELEVPLRVDRFNGAEDVEALRKDFNALHREVFAIDDPESPIEVITWRARVRCRLEQLEPSAGGAESSEGGAESRHVYFGEIGEVEVPVHAFARIEPGRSIDGPAIVESPVTTVVVNPGASVERTAAGSLSIVPWTSAAHDGAPTGIKEVTRG
jgi:N-methylhydantoinase A